MPTQLEYLKMILDTLTKNQKIISDYVSNYGEDGFVVAIKDFVGAAHRAAYTSVTILQGSTKPSPLSTPILEQERMRQVVWRAVEPDQQPLVDER